ncbi:MAG TPA: hypothetical protein VEX63_11655, partial [Flavisolibacter sp.]|nr:hypothetical protein [Flavisolibacter sp.]
MTNQNLTPKTVLSTDFSLFEATPGMRFVLLPNRPQFTIAAATHDMCTHTGLSKHQLVGNGLFEVFPSNPADPADTGEHDLMASLVHVMHAKELHQLPTQRYDVKKEGGNFSKHFWKVSNKPVLNAAGELTHIIHTTEDITKEVEASQMKKRIREMEQAHNLFLQAPVPIQIFKGPDLIMELANEPTLAIWGRGPEIIGKSLSEAIPEFKEQGYAELLAQVIQRGEPHY